MTRKITDYEITQAMQKMGGSFFQAIGRAAQAADPNNLARLKAAFPEAWAEYQLLAEYRLAQLEKEGIA